MLTEARDWESEGPRRAGVSSFGMSGTNAHVIIEQAPVDDATEAVPAAHPLPVFPVLVSARDAHALRDQAESLRAHVVDNPELTLSDLALSAATTRAALDHRAVVLGTGRGGLLDGLAALAEGRPGPVTGTSTEGQLAFLFSGQGSQR
ncbi:ketoacyl-synthetase C-terminal extension domain-containing protein, partial [Streptomyces violaceoruber]|uniref:ketoacyl-synthetase C-terminal extension domain-containing protein n=1 Tax=Streptomyces violaceoruber TaxID=1935 RepID=UPI0027E42357